MWYRKRVMSQAKGNIIKKVLARAQARLLSPTRCCRQPVWDAYPLTHGKYSYFFLVAIKTSTDVAFIFFLVQYHRMPASSFEIPPTAARPEVITKITTTFFRLLRDVKFCQRWERQCSPAKGQASLSKYDTMDNNKPNPACQPDFHHSDQMFERHSRKDRMFILGPGFRDSRVAWLHVLGQNIMVMELCMRRLSSLDDHLEIEGGKGTRIRCKACLQ